MAKEDHDKLTTQLKIQVEGFKKNAFDRVQEQHREQLKAVKESRRREEAQFAHIGVQAVAITQDSSAQVELEPEETPESFTNAANQSGIFDQISESFDSRLEQECFEYQQMKEDQSLSSEDHETIIMQFQSNAAKELWQREEVRFKHQTSRKKDEGGQIQTIRQSMVRGMLNNFRVGRDAIGEQVQTPSEGRKGIK